MAPWGWQEIVGTIGAFVLLITVVTVVIWQVAVSWRAKAALARESSYRTLAETSVATQEKIEEHLAGLDARLTELGTRLDKVQQILQEIE